MVLDTKNNTTFDDDIIINTPGNASVESLPLKHANGPLLPVPFKFQTRETIPTPPTTPIMIQMADSSTPTTVINGHSDTSDPALPPAVSTPVSFPSPPSTTLLAKFIASHKDLMKHRGNQAVKVDGHTLSTAAIVAAARHSALVRLDVSKHVRERVERSRQVVVDKVESGASIYGLSTGFGGSADTRTDQPINLGNALFQHQHMGVISIPSEPHDVLPLQDPLNSTTMPESWVRAATLVRMNSLIRGHSGVRWELIEKMKQFLCANITPVVPLRGSISASGDLSPLSYIAGALVGNPSISVYHGPKSHNARKISPSSEALPLHDIEPIVLASKEHLGLVNGTAVSAGVAALAIDDAVHLCLVAQVCTAMGTEALNGSRGSYAPFIHAVARPHPGQVECAHNIWNLLEGSKLAQLHEEEVGLDDDRYSLRQDRYPLRTAPQFLGPQLEDILSALAAVTQECNSTTDNPLVESETGHIHHGGNFQAMSVTNAMEKTRLALHHIGKLLFAQSTELCNPAMNNGLPPSLAATDPSLNYHGKGIDIATAAYVSELGFLATPVSTHIQSAEMHNQAINSLALISARATITALDVLTMLMASYIYLLCQAVDLRALRNEFIDELRDIVQAELQATFKSSLSTTNLSTLKRAVCKTMVQTYDKTTIMDAKDQMRSIAASTAPVILDFFEQENVLACPETAPPSLGSISNFRSRVSSRLEALLVELRTEYLTGGRGPSPASGYLGKTKGMYEFVREELCVPMHGAENLAGFPHGIGVDEVSVGQKITKIYEALRDGKMRTVVLSLFI